MSEPTSSLTVDHLDEYFERIQLPSRFRHEQNPQLDREFLAAIQAHHVSHIQYDNIALHYSQTPEIFLNIHDVFHKLVERKRGGYCMENNILLYHALSLIGFDVYLTGARLYRDVANPTRGWSGWEHAVNIVTLAYQKQPRYMLDVGYGGDGPTTPLPLVHEGVTTPNIGTQEIRLQKGGGPVGQRGRRNPTNEAWTYQLRNGSEQPWRMGYAFFELEFFPRDFEVMNFYTSQNPTSFLTYRLLVIRFLKNTDGKVYGKRILDQDQLKESRGGKNELVKICATESERVEVLRSAFGVDLTEEEQGAIWGKASALPKEQS